MRSEHRPCHIYSYIPYKEQVDIYNHIIYAQRLSHQRIDILTREAIMIHKISNVSLCEMFSIYVSNQNIQIKNQIKKVRIIVL